MDRRSRVVALIATCVMTLTFATVAYAYVTTDLNDFNLTETTATYGGGTQYHIATGTDGWSSYRWLDSPSKPTVMSNNTLPGLAAARQHVRVLGAATRATTRCSTAGPEQCFVVRGRTQIGYGLDVPLRRKDRSDERAQRAARRHARGRCAWPEP